MSIKDTVMPLAITSIYRVSTECRREIPLFLQMISAGFPSPAEDYIDKRLDLNEYLIKHPSATFFVRVEGDSMINAGIHHGDILIVDRALEPAHKKIIVAVINGELTVKRMHKIKDTLYLLPENDNFETITVRDEMDFQVWGVVAHVIHSI
jgi:DNA polymerase V